MAPVGNDESRRIRQLIEMLDDSIVARDELTRYGNRVLEPLLEAIPRLGWSGKRDAIELLEEIGDRRAEPALISLLRSVGGANAASTIPASPPHWAIGS